MGIQQRQTISLVVVGKATKLRYIFKIDWFDMNGRFPSFDPDGICDVNMDKSFDALLPSKRREENNKFSQVINAELSHFNRIFVLSQS